MYGLARDCQLHYFSWGLYAMIMSLHSIPWHEHAPSSNTMKVANNQPNQLGNHTRQRSGLVGRCRVLRSELRNTADVLSVAARCITPMISMGSSMTETIQPGQCTDGCYSKPERWVTRVVGPSFRAKVFCKVCGKWIGYAVDEAPRQNQNRRGRKPPER